MAINRTFSVLTAIVRLMESRDSGSRGTVHLAGKVGFPHGPEARVFLTYYNDESREPHLDFDGIDAEDPLFCVVQGRAVSAGSISKELPSFTKEHFPHFDLYVDADWVVPLFLTSDMYLNPHADCRLQLCGICTHADDSSLTFTLTVTQFAHFFGKDGMLRVRCTIPRTKRFPEKVRHKFLPYPNSLAVVWGEVKGMVSDDEKLTLDVEIESVVFMGRADSGSGTSSTPVTPSKVRTAPDSPDESPLSKMEAKRRKVVADRSQQSSNQSGASTSTVKTRSKSAKQDSSAGGGKGPQEKDKADVNDMVQQESSPLSDDDMYG